MQIYQQTKVSLNERYKIGRNSIKTEVLSWFYVFVMYFIFLAVMETKKRHLTPEQDALEHILHFKDKSFLEERPIDAVDGKNVFFLLLFC